MTQTLRSPICVVVGHVDHGKSSILDYIRNSNIVDAEAGKITQAIGASLISAQTLKKKCGTLLDAMKLTLTIPGLLFIDTPGHAAFSSLRHRGGSLADIAIVVIDIEEGAKPQTIESIKILKEYKTPFLVAVNKLDTLNGYRSCKITNQTTLLGNLAKQTPEFTQLFEKQMYTIIGQLSELGFSGERFDRVSDFTKEIGLVPTSAIQGDGMAELLMVLCALAQKYLESQLRTTVQGTAKGTILEVKEQKGLGVVMDTILHDGTLRVGDTVVIADMNEPIVTKVKALFVPTTTTDMRDKKTKFEAITHVSAATGVRICAPNCDSVLAGMPLVSVTPSTMEETKAELRSVVQKQLVLTSQDGIVIKADTLGGLEALSALLKEEQVPVRVAGLGAITKKDILEATSSAQKKAYYGCILGFNVTSALSDPSIKIVTAPVIYQLIDTYKAWKLEQEAQMKRSQLASLPALCKIKYLPGFTFRQSHPAVVGILVLAGEARSGISLMKEDGSKSGYIKSLQEQKESVPLAKKDSQVACSIDGATVGRGIDEGDVFFSSLSEEEFLLFKAYKDILTSDQKDILKEIAEIMRKHNPVWGLG